MKNLRSVFALTLTLCVFSASAATGYRTALIETVNGDSQAAGGSQPDTIYVLQSGTWNYGPTCATTWAYFNTKDYPQFLAIVLTARASDRPLTVVVDDSLPKVSGFCRITSVQL